MRTGAGQGGLYQVVVGTKGSPELSSERIPDVNWVFPAAAGHTERNTVDTEALVLSKGRKPTDQPSPLPSEGHT